MNDLEQKLEGDLRRVGAPAGFAERVMARVAAETNDAPSPGRRSGVSLGSFFDWRWLRPVLAAAMVLLACFGSLAIHRAHVREVAEQRQAALTQARFALAMRLTSRSLANASREVEEAGVKVQVHPRRSND